MSKKNDLKKVFLFLLTLNLLSHINVQANDLAPINIIPQPVSVTQGKGAFKLSSSTVLNAQGVGKDIARLFSDMIRIPTGFAIKTASNSKGTISLILNEKPDPLIGNEGYMLDVKTSEISLSANQPAGLFYGMQTLLQLLPKEILSATAQRSISWQIPVAKIVDYPRFGWRGLMLDVSRHFFDKAFVKKYIDQLSAYKMNVFHWHLTDDQGWRIEIKSLPKLTEVGAWRVPRSGNWGNREQPFGGEKPTYGGYYTQEDIREIIDYAKQRYVRIIPEIDVPGHSLAAIAAYPELSCTGGRYNVNPGSKFYTFEDNAFCAGNEASYDFINKVLTEVAALFPGEYIHIGGDECYKGFWQKCPKCQKKMNEEKLATLEELQGYYIKRIGKIIHLKGKKMIGWDEILEGGLAPDAAVMSWRGTEGGIAAANMNHLVVMTPTSHCYLDLYQGDLKAEPPTYSSLRLTNCYNFEPVLAEIKDSSLVLGGQGNLWTESVPHARHAEYMVWPRALALAEVFWTPKSQKDQSKFIVRMEAHMERFDVAGINYARSVYDPIITAVKKNWMDPLRIVMKTEVPGLDIQYTFDGTYPDQFSPKYTDTLSIPVGPDIFRAISYRNGKLVGKMITLSMCDIEQRVGK